MSADERAERQTILDRLRHGRAPLQALASALHDRFGPAPEGGWGPVAAHHIDRLTTAGVVHGDREWHYSLADGAA